MKDKRKCIKFYVIDFISSKQNFGQTYNWIIASKIKQFTLKSIPSVLSVYRGYNQLDKLNFGKKRQWNQTFREVSKTHITLPKLDQALSKIFTVANMPGNKLQTEGIHYTKHERKQNDLNQPEKNPHSYLQKIRAHCHFTTGHIST